MVKNSPKVKINHIRHSLAHLLAMAVLKKFPEAKLGIGPTIENGFYYDFDLARDSRKQDAESIRPDARRGLSDADLPEIEKEMRRLIRQKLDFRGEQVTPAKAKKIFKDQPFKLDLIKEYSKEGRQLTIYHTGDFVDLCKGGHIKNTSEINPDAFRLTSIAGAYWRGSEKNPMLTRIYGAAFETKEELEDYQRLQKEIERRDHRMLGEKLDLFSQHSVAPGAIFWHHKGMILWRVLEKFIREKLDAEGYEEVSTPIMVKKEVFVKSGHWEHYRENMFTLKDNGDEYVLKPMNCPESTYIYASRLRSFRDLPLRLSEVTDRLHRNERSGTLGGLFRVRQLTQDDAHIYCTPDQIESEVRKLFSLIQEVYSAFGLPVSYKLATRPDKAMGSPALWKKAEEALKAILEKSGKPYEIKSKDGAFYGPKIDIHIKDALGRDWQLATIQLDFQLAERFNLFYTDSKGGKQRPVVIHRAVFGTFERFIGILIEHYAGAFPFWLAPVQIAVLTVTDAAKSYAEVVVKTLRREGHRVYFDERNETIGKKIREGELQKIPYLLVIGPKEAEGKSVAVRARGKGDIGGMTLEKFMDIIKKEI